MTSTSARSSSSAEASLDQVFRTEWGRLLARLVARTRRLDLAEEALGEAFARAAQRWPSAGVPHNPAGWLYTTALRQLIGRVRAEAIAGRKAPLLVVRPGGQPEPGDPEGGVTGGDDAGLADERIHLIVLCCHPALAPEARAALALRLVVGTPTAEIARLFLVPRPTMAARLTRAKKKIVAAGIPLGAPAATELEARLEGVCRTIYLAFSAGYSPGEGADLLRADLAGEAVELAEVVHRLVPEDPAARALLALLLVQHARRDARLDGGRLVALGDQDRSRWHHDEIDRGRRLLDGLVPGEGYGEELRLQAAIAVEHGRAATAATTRWSVIAARYRDLEACTGSPVVRLNRAVAVAEADGPQAGLALLEGLDVLLPGSHRVPSVRGALARRAGQVDLARASWQRALVLCANEVERAHLAAQLAALDRDGSPGEAEPVR